jgi:hypothetical protein
MVASREGEELEKKTNTSIIPNHTLIHTHPTRLFTHTTASSLLLLLKLRGSS